MQNRWHGDNFQPSVYNKHLDKSFGKDVLLDVFKLFRCWIQGHKAATREWEERVQGLNN